MNDHQPSRQKAINELKQICQEIGCSGLEPDMCQDRPERCNIIRKVLRRVKPAVMESPKH